MIKECKVLSRNSLVMVVDYDGKEVQLPTDGRRTPTVYVKHDATFEVVSKEDFDKQEAEKQKVEKKEAKKKTRKRTYRRRVK